MSKMPPMDYADDDGVLLDIDEKPLIAQELAKHATGAAESPKKSGNPYGGSDVGPLNSIPAFLTKLWRMVNDPATNSLIRWNTDGKSFIVRDKVQFWYELLPQYYKHNNMASFVRQLNMYGFHKIAPEMTAAEIETQYQHACFQRGKPELMASIKRKTSTSRAAGRAADSMADPDSPHATMAHSSPSEQTGHTTVRTSETGNTVQSVNIDASELARILNDVKELHSRQSNVSDQLTDLKNENTVLWRELTALRQKHRKQQSIVNKLIHFLVTLVQPQTAGSRMGVKRSYPLMIHSAASSSGAGASNGRSSTASGTSGVASSPGPTATGSGVRLPKRNGNNVSPETATGVAAALSATLAGIATPKRRKMKLVLDQLDDDTDEDLLLDSEVDPDLDDGGGVGDGDVGGGLRIHEVRSPCSGVNLDASGADDEVIEEYMVLPEHGHVLTDQYEDTEISPNYKVLVEEPPSVEPVTSSPSTTPKRSAGMTGHIPSSTFDMTGLDESETNLLNLVNGAYGNCANSIFGTTAGNDGVGVSPKHYASQQQHHSQQPAGAMSSTMAVATRDPHAILSRLNSRDDLDQHVENTQSELDSIKEIICGSGSVDFSALLGLFSEESPYFPLSAQPTENQYRGDPMVSSTMMPYEVDFSELVDDDNEILPIDLNKESNPAPVDGTAAPTGRNEDASASQSINTPLIFDGVPVYPTDKK